MADERIPLAKSGDQKSAKKEKSDKVRLVKSTSFKTILKLRMRKKQEVNIEERCESQPCLATIIQHIAISFLRENWKNLGTIS